MLSHPIYRGLSAKILSSWQEPLLQDTMYFEVPYKESNTAYVVMETDIISTPGVEYVTVDPSYIRGGSDEVKTEQSTVSFWFSGGNN